MVAAGHPSRRPEAAACHGAAGVPLGRGDCYCGPVAVLVTLDTQAASDWPGHRMAAAGPSGAAGAVMRFNLKTHFKQT